MSDESPRRWHSVLAAILSALVLLVILSVLFVLTLGTIGLALAVGAGLFLLVAMHYFVWGWWLGPAIERDLQDEDDDADDRGW